MIGVSVHLGRRVYRFLFMVLTRLIRGCQDNVAVFESIGDHFCFYHINDVPSLIACAGSVLACCGVCKWVVDPYVWTGYVRGVHRSHHVSSQCTRCSCRLASKYTSIPGSDLRFIVCRDSVRFQLYRRVPVPLVAPLLLKPYTTHNNPVKRRPRDQHAIVVMSLCPCNTPTRSRGTQPGRQAQSPSGTGVQVAKMVQLHQCREQRMGVILMGPAGSGKTTLWRTLAAAYSRLGRGPVIFTLNPKAMPRKQLLGYMDADTRCAPQPEPAIVLFA